MSYTLQLNKNQADTLNHKYFQYSIANKNQYVYTCFKYQETTVTIYKTYKALIQGKNDENVYSEICNTLKIPCEIQPKINQTVVKYHSVMGSDEVGTGDFFGGIVVCACYIPEAQEQEIIDLGVKDSKLLNDQLILEIGPTLIKKVKFSYRYLDNQKYNALYRSQSLNMNMNKIKAILHNSVLINLYNKINSSCDLIVVDAFTPQNKYFDYLKDQEDVLRNVKLIEKAEKLFTSVACASCIARYIFLKNMEALEEKYGYQLPKGASNLVDDRAKQIIDEKGVNYLNNIAKLNFKTLDKALKK